MLFFRQLKKKDKVQKILDHLRFKQKNGRFVRLENFLNFKEINEAKELHRYNKNESNNS